MEAAQWSIQLWPSFVLEEPAAAADALEQLRHTGRVGDVPCSQVGPRTGQTFEQNVVLIGVSVKAFSAPWDIGGGET